MPSTITALRFHSPWAVSHQRAVLARNPLSIVNASICLGALLS